MRRFITPRAYACSEPGAHPTDWSCPECGFESNFGSRGDCFKCGAFRPGQEGLIAPNRVLARLAEADARGPGAKGQKGGRGMARETKIERLTGDWDCPQCGFMNFAAQDDCRKCAEPRPSGTGKVHNNYY
eukprot:1195749-Prorocentrum_minimum.AAC.2